MSVPRCIICDKPPGTGVFSIEHVFPEAIGGAYAIRTVCGPCNSVLGTKVDAELTDHIFIQMRRSALNLPGKSGRVPDPLAQGQLTGSPGLTVRDVLAPDVDKLRVVTSVEKEIYPDSSEAVRIRADARDGAQVVEMINKMLARKGIPPMSPEEIHRHIKKVVDPEPEVVVRVVADLVRYKPALLKIAYELTATWLGNAYLDDPLARGIRAVLLDDQPATALKALGDGARISWGAGATRASTDGSSGNHRALVSVAAGNRILGEVQIFDCFVATILMSEDAKRYPEFTGRRIDIDAVAGTCAVDPL